MSYCRFSEGDVYVFQTTAPRALECCACIMSEHSQRFGTRSEMIAHLREHEAAGHSIPGGVIEGLEQEIEDIGDEVTDKLGANA